METNELISIVIPIYNVEKYLENCIKSVLNQTYSHLEIILVNDGSKDNSEAICNKYKNIDRRIKYYKKINGGLSDARNFGIKRATGKYITFIDSDDYVSKHYVENLYLAMKKSNADLVISDFKMVWDSNFNESDSLDQNNIQVVSNEECLTRLLYQDGVETSTWGKLYQLSYFQDYHIEYPVGKLYEDIPVTFDLIRYSKKIAIIPNKDYFYFQRNNSIQYENFSHRKMDIIVNMNYLEKGIQNYFPNLIKAMDCRYFSAISNVIFQIGDKSKFKDDYNLLWSELKKRRRSVLLNNEARTKARIGALLSYFGYSLYKAIYKKTQVRGQYEKN